MFVLELFDDVDDSLIIAVPITKDQLKKINNHLAIEDDDDYNWIGDHPINGISVLVSEYKE